MEALNWRKSSRSNTNGSCVEVATTADAVLTRDSKDPDPNRPILTFSAAAWGAFTRDLHAGRYDR